MAQIDVNPEELAGFARALRDYAEKEYDELKKIEGHFKRLKETWRDQDAQRAEAELAQAHKVLTHHWAECVTLAQTLGERARKLEEAQRIR